MCHDNIKMVVKYMILEIINSKLNKTNFSEWMLYMCVDFLSVKVKIAKM